MIGCFAGKKEGTCDPSQAAKCSKASGIDHSAITSCVSDKSTKDAVYRAVWKTGRRIQSFPHLEIDGKLVNADTPEGISEALCKAGAKAACR